MTSKILLFLYIISLEILIFLLPATRADNNDFIKLAPLLGRALKNGGRHFGKEFKKLASLLGTKCNPNTVRENKDSSSESLLIPEKYGSKLGEVPNACCLPA